MIASTTVPFADVNPLDGPMPAAPSYAQYGDAGADLTSVEGVQIAPGHRALVGTGLAVAIPNGFVGLIWPRSGLAARHGIDVLAGVIDSGYRGEVKVALLNTGTEPFTIRPGDRVAQLLIQPVVEATFTQVARLDDLPAAPRGSAGFGSTGR